MEVTGRHLKVGDVVRYARCGLGFSPRELGEHLGRIVKLNPSNGRVQVLWQTGSTGRHDAHMLVKVDEPFPE